MADDIFSAIANAVTPYKVTAAGVNSQGQFIDANGQPISEYQQPNWFERALSPQAQQIASLNAQGQAYPMARQQEQNVNRNLMMQNIASLPTNDNPYLGAFGRPQSPTATNDPLASDEQSMYSGLISSPTPNYPDFNSGAPTKVGVSNNALREKENQAWVTEALNPQLSPSNLQVQQGSQGALNTGLVGQTGANNAVAENATSGYNRQVASALQSTGASAGAATIAEANNRLAKDLRVDPLELQHQRQVLSAQVGQDAAEAQINANFNKVKLAQSQASVNTIPQTTQAQIDQDHINAGLIAQQRHDLGLTTGTMGNNSLWENIASQTHPDSLVSEPYLMTRNPDGSVNASGGVLNPRFRPAAAATMAAIKNGVYSGVGNGAVQTPKGVFTPAIDPNANILHPTIGAGGQPQQSTNSISPTNQSDGNILGVSTNSPIFNPQPPPHVQLQQNNQTASHLTDAENVMKTLGLLSDDELVKGKGRAARRITDQQEESLIKSRIPLLLKQYNNPNMRPAERQLIGQIAGQFGQ